MPAMSKKTILVYYSILLLILLSWHNPIATPPEFIRILYLTAVMLPAILKAPSWIPIIITLFYAISNYGSYVSYMPNQMYLYVLFPAAAICIKIKKSTQSDFASLYVLIFCAYTFLLNICNSSTFESITACLALLFLFFKLIPYNSTEYIHLFSCAFSLISLVLSSQFVFGGSTFQTDFGSGGFDRTEWMDPNYFGCVIGIGAITSLIEALLNRSISKFTKCIFFIIYGFSCYVLISNASRGALLATFSSSIVLFLLSDMKLGIKILSTAIFCLFVILLYENSVFDFLLYRMQLDEGRGGSGRTSIWLTKYHEYNKLPFWNQLFGIGYRNGMKLGFGYARGFHNDYIAFLVEYGAVGLLMALYFLIKPTFKCYNRFIVLAILIYIVMASCTLEPLSGGMIIYFSFYLYAILISKSKEFLCSGMNL